MTRKHCQTLPVKQPRVVITTVPRQVCLHHQDKDEHHGPIHQDQDNKASVEAQYEKD